MKFITAPKPRHNLNLTAPIDRWDEAIPLGNGLMGVLLWGDSESIKLSLDRGDLWDLRTPEAFKKKDFNWQNLKKLVAVKNMRKINTLFNEPYTGSAWPTKIPAGRIELLIDKSNLPEMFSLNLRKAVGKVKMKEGALEMFCSATEPVCLSRFAGADVKVRIVSPRFAKPYKTGKNGLGEIGQLAALGYPASMQGKHGNLQWVVQECSDGFKYVVVVGSRKTADYKTEMAFTVTCSNDGNDPLEIGSKRVLNALKNGYEKMLKPHIKWWKGFWSKSAISIPHKQAEQHYYLVQYFYGATSRLGAPAISLQGVWTADSGSLPPWKGDYHHDANTQMSYWAYQTANHMDEGRCFIEFMWNLLPRAREFARDFYRTPGACFPSVMALDGQPLGGWPQYSFSPTNSAWIAHHFYLHWKYTMNLDFLRERAYPFCKAIAECLEAMFESGKDGKLKLPLSSSSEIHSNTLEAWVTPNSNYDLAIMRWLFEALIEMSMHLKFQDETNHWKNILDQLDDLAVSDTTYKGKPGVGSLMVAPDEMLTESHRHFSHLMAIYPLGTLHIEGSERDRTVIEQSLRQMDRLGMNFWCGFSFTWMSCLAARIGYPDRALTMLELFFKGFISRNGFNLNCDYKSLGLCSYEGRPFTLEANFVAGQSIHEMLLQSWGGVLRIFPAMPNEWLDAGFDSLRTEGAFLVSARRENGQTMWIRIVAECSGQFKVKDPFNGKKVFWNNRKIKKIGKIYQCNLKTGDSLDGKILENIT